MVSPHTGSDELVYIKTDKVCVTIKGRAAHPNFQNVEYQEGDSVFKVFCNDDYDLSLKGCADSSIGTVISGVRSGIYAIQPLFFEQQPYELVVEAVSGHDVSFWHENFNVRKKITPTGRNSKILSGIVNFGNEIGFSDLIFRINGNDYLRIVIEVFPTKISYKEDYQSIVADVTNEVYSLIFDFLKKTYLGYRQGDRVSSSPVEFFAIIHKIFCEFIKSADIILSRPHHMLVTTHEVLPAHKVKRTDARTIRWVEKHPKQAIVTFHGVAASRALAVKKLVTYDTKENRLTKYILNSTMRRLTSFKKNYLQLQREEDRAVTARIDAMIGSINRRCNDSFLSNVGTHEAAAGLSLVFLMAPGYRDLYRCYLMLLRGLSITGDVFNISIKDLAVLYEYWCFIKLNSLMKQRYELVSQDVIKVQGNGLYVSLVKGRGSHVKYKNPKNGEAITLSYNPNAISVPTIAQRPDNVLTLEKKGADTQYEFVFDAKYRINPALPETDYFKSVFTKPGPEVDDINTMHRYRDAIVYQKDANPFQRTMFGAYVLFPYGNEKEYINHRFYKSIGEVNIGGLPFLPSSTNLVADMLDELIADSPDSSFERATLPRGIERKLAQTDWSVRDVLVGSLRNQAQLDVNLRHKFYHIQVARLRETDFPIRYVAIYQSINIFGTEAGIRYYGEVTKCIQLPRSQIKEIPKNSNEPYYRFEVKDWKKLAYPIMPKEIGHVSLFTNMFLLKHSMYFPELKLRSEEEFRLYTELKRLENETAINDEDSNFGFVFKGSTVVLESGMIRVIQNNKYRSEYAVSEFSRSPNAVFRRVYKELVNNQAVEVIV